MCVYVLAPLELVALVRGDPVGDGRGRAWIERSEWDSCVAM